MPASTLFVYGTLMSPQVVKVLLGRVPSIIEPAVIEGYSRHPVVEQVYPGLIPSSGKTTTGLLLEGIEPHELEVLDWFEGDDYEKKTVTVMLLLAREQQQQQRTVQAYVWSRPQTELHLDREWDFSCFCDTRLDWYLENTVQPCRDEMDRLGVGRQK